MKYDLETTAMDFIKYCQKHPIDMNIINKCSAKVLWSNGYQVNTIQSGDYLYCLYMYKTNAFTMTYVFRFKDQDTIDNFMKIYNPTVKRKLYSFDYENNEMLTMINGHCLKSYIRKTILHENCIDTFDSNTGLKLMDVDMKNTFISNNIQAIIGELSAFADETSWIRFKTIPAELKDLVTAQKVMLSMIGE